MKILKLIAILLLCSTPVLILSDKMLGDGNNQSKEGNKTTQSQHTTGSQKGNPKIKGNNKVPINGGIYILLIAGVAFGAVTLATKSNNKNALSTKRVDVK